MKILPFTTHHEDGATLLEVLISMLVVALGLLGLAKMQALALTGIQASNSRSLASTHTASMAAAMRANWAYWGMRDADLKISKLGQAAVEVVGDAFPSSAPTCEGGATSTSPACTPGQFAARTLEDWRKSMQGLLAGFDGEIACNKRTIDGLGTATVPVRCTITVKWQERYASATGKAATASAATQGERTYILHVQP